LLAVPVENALLKLAHLLAALLHAVLLHAAEPVQHAVLKLAHRLDLDRAPD